MPSDEERAPYVEKAEVSFSSQVTGCSFESMTSFSSSILNLQLDSKRYENEMAAYLEKRNGKAAPNELSLKKTKK